MFRTAEAMWDEIAKFRKNLPQAGARIALIVEGAKANAYQTFGSVKFSLELPAPLPRLPEEALQEIAARHKLDVVNHEPWGPQSRELQLLRAKDLVARLRSDKLFVAPSVADLALFKELVRLYKPDLVP